MHYITDSCVRIGLNTLNRKDQLKNMRAMVHGVERGTTSDAFLGGGENERCGNFKVSILSLINFSF